LQRLSLVARVRSLSEEATKHGAGTNDHHRPAGIRVIFLLAVDAERVVKGGRDLVGRDRFVRGSHAVVVAGPQHLSAEDAAAGHEHGKRTRLVGPDRASPATGCEVRVQM